MPMHPTPVAGPRQGSRATRHATLVMLALAATACAGSGATPSGTAGRGAPAPEVARGFPGFDASVYPGDEVMRAWRSASPYRWVGYYLPAPCHRDASWAGTRGRLEAMGWGTAVLYVGQQAWEGVADSPPADSAAAPRPIICSRTLLSDSVGRRDADAAIVSAAADGFPPGTVIHLDIEPVTAVSADLRSYYTAWTRRLLEEGRFRPGLYAHRRNAAEIHADMKAAAVEAGASTTGTDVHIPLWIAAPTADFSLVRAPREAGVAAASIWQGRLTFDEAWGGTSLRIDANVADSPSPSAPVGSTRP